MMKEMKYEDYKYVMSDTSSIYLGAKYSYEELLQSSEVPFKLQAIVEHYLLKDTALDTTVESHFYYMTKDSFSYRTYEKLKVRVKVCELVEKKGFFGKGNREYVQKQYPLGDFCEINLAQKKMRGIVIQEIVLSKLAMTFFEI